MTSCRLLAQEKPVFAGVCTQDRRGQAGDPATDDVGALLVDTGRRRGVDAVIVAHGLVRLSAVRGVDDPERLIHRDPVRGHVCVRFGS